MTKISYIGHATLLIEMDGLRILTDPLLRRTIGHLRRQGPPPPSEVKDADLVLISHLHGDHLDIQSLIEIGRDKRIIVPRGAAPYLKLKGFTRVEEIDQGESVQIGSVRISATQAEHSGRRLPWIPAVRDIGYLLNGTLEIYFAGDTGIFEEMAEIGKGIDLALLPVWGWGPTLGPGHMDPLESAEALLRLKPKAAIPIHWGTYCPVILDWFKPNFLSQPPLDFQRFAADIAPEVRIKILMPGQSAQVERMLAGLG